MKIIKIKNHTLEFYDSIEEIPIRNFHKFNKYLLIESGVGSDLDSINAKINRIIWFIQKKDDRNAVLELNNIRQGFHLISQNLNLEHLATVALLKSIDGKPVENHSLETHKKLVELLQDEPIGKIRKLFLGLKKKIENELFAYFPSQFDNSSTKEYLDSLKNRALALLDSLIRKKDNSEILKKIDDYLYSLIKPNPFFGKENREIAFDKQFEDMCLFLSQEINQDPWSMTVLQFYNSFEYIKRKLKKLQRGR